MKKTLQNLFHLLSSIFHPRFGRALAPRVLAFLLLASPLARSQFTWTTNTDNTITITGYTGPGGDVAIPDSITGRPVTTIGDTALQFNSSLVSVTIPNSVTNIGNRVFSYSTELTAVNVDTNDSFYSSVNGVLFDKSQTTLIAFPGGLIGSYTIPSSVTNIGDSAFYYCTNLTSVTIPGSVTSIGDGAFAGTSLTSVTIPNSVTLMQNGAFYFCTNLTSVTIPNSVSSIGGLAFYFCTGLTNLTIADGVTSIEAQAFSGCVGLTTITLPSSVRFIGILAFGYCSNLTSAIFMGNAPTFDPAYWYNFAWRPFTGDPVTAYYLPDASGWPLQPPTTWAPPPVWPEVLWNPAIQTADGSFGVQGNQFGFNITGAADIPIAVEASTSLANPVWTPLATMTLTNGSVYFSEPVQTNTPARFYRIGSP